MNEETAGKIVQVRLSRGHYVCCGGPEGKCNTSIVPGDHYVSVTLKLGPRFKTRRYCLPCGNIYHGDLVEEAPVQLKSKKAKLNANKSIRETRFAAIKSRQFKRKATKSEEMFWEFLNTAQLKHRFERQKAIHGYVLDFYCAQKRLCIELDGKRHSHQKEKDKARDADLMQHGIRVLRFPSSLIYSDVHYVLERIRAVLLELV